MRNGFNNEEVWEWVLSMPSGVGYQLTSNEQGRVMVKVLFPNGAFSDLYYKLSELPKIKVIQDPIIRDRLVDRICTNIYELSRMGEVSLEAFLSILENVFEDDPDSKWYVFVIVKYIFSVELADQVHKVLESKVRATISHPELNTTLNIVERRNFEA